MNNVVERELSAQLLSALHSVYRGLGQGLLESVYESALMVELQAKGQKAERQVPFKVFYRGQEVGHYYADLVLEKRIIVEIKAVKQLNEVMVAQLMNYLRISRITLSYLVNFGGPRLEWNRYVH